MNATLLSSGDGAQIAPATLRVGPFVHVARLSAETEAETPIQASDLLRRAMTALAASGASASDVVRTRFYVGDLMHAAALRAEHARFFGDHASPATIVHEPATKLALDLDAVVSDASPRLTA